MTELEEMREDEGKAGAMTEEVADSVVVVGALGLTMGRWIQYSNQVHV